MPKVESIRDLAKALGVAPSTATGYVRRSDWPGGVPRVGPWTPKHLAALRAWKGSFQEDRASGTHTPGNTPAPGSHGTSGNTTASPSSGTSGASGGGGAVDPVMKEKAKIAVIFHRGRKLKVDADEAEGRVVPREQMEEAMAALTTVFVQTGDDMVDRLPHVLDGDRAKNEEIVRDAWHDMRRRILEQAVIDLSKITDEIRDRLVTSGQGSRGGTDASASARRAESE